jgi:ankyrin repeat protein
MPGFDELCAAVYRNDLETLENSLVGASSKDLRDSDGRTLLMHAVLTDESSPSMVKFLIERGVDNRSPDLELVRLLMDFGADPRRRNNNGVNPIDIARRMGHQDLSALLEQSRAMT